VKEELLLLFHHDTITGTSTGGVIRSYDAEVKQNF
jgi:hypothetical protein